MTDTSQDKVSEADTLFKRDLANLQSGLQFLQVEKAELVAEITRLRKERDQAVEALNLAWQNVNALGGYAGSEYDCGYVDGITTALGEIEKVGGSDPLSKSTRSLTQTMKGDET